MHITIFTKTHHRNAYWGP